MLRRFLSAALLLVVPIVVMGCPVHSDYVADVEFEGRQYYPIGGVFIPEADLSAIGSASQVRFADVRDRTVFSVAGMDPAAVIAMRWDASSWQPSEEEPQPPNINVVVFADPELAELPVALCRYFDPRDPRTPLECQSEAWLTVDGLDFIPIEGVAEKTAKAGAGGYIFLPTELTAIEALERLDARLGEDVDPTVYAIAGVDPAAAVALVRGEGFGVEHLVFVALGTDAVPASLCRYASPEAMLELDMLPEGCLVADDDPRVGLFDDLAGRPVLPENQLYEYTIELRCFCPPELRGPFRVRASHLSGLDSPAEIRADGRLVEVNERPHRWVGRIHDLLLYVELYVRSDEFEVRFDPAYGYPIELFADPDASVTDDEFGFVITDFELVR